MVQSSPNYSSGKLETTIHGRYTRVWDKSTDYITLTPNDGAEHQHTLIWLHGMTGSSHSYSDFFAD